MNSNIPGLNEGEGNSNKDYAYLPDQLINPSSSKITSFQYQWDDNKGVLVFRFISDGKTAIRINIQFSGTNTLDFTADINNLFRGTGVRFDFPQGLLFSTVSLNRFIYPEGIGVAFKPDFYQENKTQSGHYPPLFSDYVSLETGNETLAIYAIQKKDEFNPADLFTGGYGTHQGIYEHRFITFITPGSEWKSPVLRWVLGETTQQSLFRYSLDNGLALGKSLDRKLGNDLFDKVAKGLTVKADIREQGNFERVLQALSNYPEGSLFHPVNYWNKGFDRNYPDFLPPDEGLGNDSGFRKMIQTAHDRKMLVMPYTNFTWWNESPSLNSIDRKSITSQNLDGTLRIEYYNNGSGHVVTPQHPEVKRICLPIIQKLQSDYKIDILFEDQLGARPWMYDRNTVSETPIGYVQGIINLAKDHTKDIPLYTERGFDFLIPEISGFCGLPNLSYPNFKDLNSKWGAGNWECYPLAQYLAHDKTAFYQHDLAVETMTDTIEKLSWNLVYGYGLTINMKQDISSDEKEWVRILGEIHRLIIAKYTGKKLISYTPSESGLVQSQYGDLLIWGNFSDRDQEINQTRLSGWKVSRGGFLVTDTKYNPLAGVFSSWKNGTFTSPHLILFETTGKLKIKTDYAIPEPRLIYDPTKIKHTKISKKIEKHKILLTNNQMTVSLSPDWGGRILSLSLNSDGFNPLYFSDNDDKSKQGKNDWIELGGINDWFPGDFPGELWANWWSIKEEDSNSDTIRLLSGRIPRIISGFRRNIA